MKAHRFVRDIIAAVALTLTLSEDGLASPQRDFNSFVRDWQQMIQKPRQSGIKVLDTGEKQRRNFFAGTFEASALHLFSEQG